MSKATVLALSLLGSVAALVLPQTAFATHAHPANLGAKKLTWSVVPAFKPCTSPTGTHGTPLAGASCQTTSSSAASPNLTTGTGTSSKGTSSLSLEVICTNGATPPCSGTAGDQEDVKITATGTDVRCKAAIAGNPTLCPSANSAGGKDYSGQLQGNAQIRITDHYNTGSGTCSSTTSCSATVVDLPFPVTGTCAATSADATIGSTCNVSTSADVVVPGVVKEGKKSNVEIGQLVINDGGTDGLATTAPNSLFNVQGIYIP
jgi:hypothetical protein